MEREKLVRVRICPNQGLNSICVTLRQHVVDALLGSEGVIGGDVKYNGQATIVMKPGMMYDSTRQTVVQRKK